MDWTPELVCLVVAAAAFLLATLGIESVVPGGWVPLGLFALTLYFLIPVFGVDLTTLLIVLLIVLVLVLIVYFVRKTRAAA